MIKVSYQAAEVLAEALSKSEVDPNEGLRLMPKKQGFTLELDAPRSNDRVISYSGVTVLIVEDCVEDKIGDAMIDLERQADGLDLVIRRRLGG